MVISGQAFSSVEQYYMYSKAMLCGDSKAAMEILGTNNAAKMKQIGRRVNVEERRQGLEGCRAKFNGSAELSKRLLATGLRPIAEAGTPLGLDLWDRAVAVRSTGAGSEKVARAESARAGFGDGARGAQAQGVVLSRRWCNDMQSI